jgi:hypothetical protein
VDHSDWVKWLFSPELGNSKTLLNQNKF